MEEGVFKKPSLRLMGVYTPSLVFTALVYRSAFDVCCCVVLLDNWMIVRKNDDKNNNNNQYRFVVSNKR